MMTLSDLLEIINDNTLIDLADSEGNEIVLGKYKEDLDDYIDYIVWDMSVWKGRLLINIEEEL